MIGLGIDPSLTRLAYATVRMSFGLKADQTGQTIRQQVFEVLDVGIIKAPVNTHGVGMIHALRTWDVPHFDIGLVEKMQSRTFGDVRGASDKADILDLNMVSGACFAHLIAGPSDRVVVAKLPAEWKGTTPKEKHQPWICKSVGWTYVEGGIPVGSEAFKLNRGEWREGLDAVGMAVHAIQKFDLYRMEARILAGRAHELPPLPEELDRPHYYPILPNGKAKRPRGRPRRPWGT